MACSWAHVYEQSCEIFPNHVIPGVWAEGYIGKVYTTLHKATALDWLARHHELFLLFYSVFFSGYWTR